MNNEEKILAILEKHGEMLEKHSEMFLQLADRMERMQAGLTQVQSDLTQVQSTQARMQADLTQVQSDLTHVKEDVTGIKARLDYDVDARLTAMNDRIDAILKKQETLDQVKGLAEETRDRVDVIHAVVTQHSTAITELKQAR